MIKIAFKGMRFTKRSKLVNMKIKKYFYLIFKGLRGLAVILVNIYHLNNNFTLDILGLIFSL